MTEFETVGATFSCSEARQELDRIKQTPRVKEAIAALVRYPKLLRCSLEKVSALQKDINVNIKILKRRWRSLGFKGERSFLNWASLLRYASRMATGVTRASYKEEWSSMIQKANSLCEDSFRIAGITTVARLASEDGITPAQLNDEWMSQKIENLENTDKKKLRRAIVHWNYLIDVGLDGKVLNKQKAAARKVFRADPSVLPESLRQEIGKLIMELKARGTHDTDIDPVEAALSELRQGTPLSEVADLLPSPDELTQRRLSASYVHSIEAEMYSVAGALIRSGVAASALTTIKDLVTPRAAALRAAEQVQRRQVKDAASANTSIQILCMVARRVGVDDEWLSGLKAVSASPYVKTPSVRAMGYSRSNQLAQFDSEEAVYTWIILSRLMEKKAIGLMKANKWKEGIKYLECAVIIDIIQFGAVRIGNVTRARLGTNKANIYITDDDEQEVSLRWRKEEVKNHRQIDVDLPAAQSRRLRALLKDEIRQRVLDQYSLKESDALFPGRGRDGFRSNLSSMCRKACLSYGLDLTPHLARALANKLILDFRPDLKSIAASVLGDTDRVIEAFYTVRNDSKGLRDYQDAILKMQADTAKKKGLSL